MEKDSGEITRIGNDLDEIKRIDREFNKSRQEFAKIKKLWDNKNLMIDYNANQMMKVKNVDIESSRMEILNGIDVVDDEIVSILKNKKDYDSLSSWETFKEIIRMEFDQIYNQNNDQEFLSLTYALSKNVKEKLTSQYYSFAIRESVLSIPIVFAHMLSNDKIIKNITFCKYMSNLFVDVTNLGYDILRCRDKIFNYEVRKFTIYDLFSNDEIKNYVNTFKDTYKYKGLDEDIFNNGDFIYMVKPEFLKRATKRVNNNYVCSDDYIIN